MTPLVVDARPAPHVFIVILRFALVEDSRTYSPHDDAEDEETDGEYGVVGCYFLGSIVTSSEIRNHNYDRHDKGDTGDCQKKDLRPGLGVVGPWWKAVSLWKRFCSVENCECGCDHGKDDETAGKVDAAQKDLRNSYSNLDFLLVVSFTMR